MPVNPTTPPPGPSKSSQPQPQSNGSPSPLSNYRRSPSVSEVVNRYEHRNRSNPSTPPNERRPSVPTPKRTGISSRVGPLVKSPPGSPRKEERRQSTGIEGSSRSGNMTGVKVVSGSKVNGMGLGTPIGGRIVENRRATDSRVRSTRPSIPTASSIPKPSPSSINPSRILDRTHSSPRTTPKPFPTSSAKPLPRSTSDTFYTSSTSRSTTPSSSTAGPSRLTSPKKTAVEINVSRPSPSPDKRPPPLRRKSSKADLNQPKSPVPSNTRRPSHRVTESISSQSSNHSTYQSSTISSRSNSTVYYGEFGERENQPTPIALDSEAPPMVRGGVNRSSRSSQGTIETGDRSQDVVLTLNPGSPGKEKVSINIPKRTSSNSNSPRTPRSAGPPPISPRTTSRRLSSPTKQLPSSLAAQRAMKNGMSSPTLGFESASDKPRHRRTSSQSSVSRLSEAPSTIREPLKGPTSAATSRPTSEITNLPTASSTSHTTPPSSPKGSPSRLAARRPSSSPRKSPNLTIQTPPPMLSSRLSSVTSVPAPSPPVPAKSPLRSLSRENSDPNYPGRSQTPRSGSGESNMAQSGTPTSLRTRLDKMAETDEDHPNHIGAKAGLNNRVDYTPPQDQINSSVSQVLATPNAIRFTSFTIPSMYSQESAPPSATSWAWSENTARSSIDGTATRRQSRLSSVDWGKQKNMPPSSQRSSFDLGREGGHRRSSSLPRLSITDKALPYVPDETPTTATTVPSTGHTGHSTPLSPISPDHKEPAKSPSLPILREGKTARYSYTPDSPLPAIQSPSLLSSTNANSRHSGGTESTLRPLLPTSPSIVMSKRSHLIREIASSERAYARDLRLIVEAYMYRFLRPSSQTSTNGDSSISPSEVSRRSSVYTYQTAETKRSSGYDSANWIFPNNGSSTPLPKSPSDGYNLGYFHGSAAGSSNSSFQMTPQPSLKNHKRSSSSIPSMPPPIGKPLSPADLKTVFLNLDQLASAAEDLATAFEQAMGEEGEGLGALAREGEVGSDKLGQVFVDMIPRIRPLYNFYCARQSQASLRLLELQSDPAHNAHLKECWLSVKDHTHAWNLDSMLIKPVQRITKYPLLFDDLLLSTTPVHPDYFAIRTAAQMSKAIAMEIDEAKRRKDVVSNVINSKKLPTTNVSPKENKQPTSKLLGLKRFRKDKAISSNVSLSKSTSSSELSLPSVISETSLSSLKDLTVKIEELDQGIRRVGKEVVLWTAAAKEVLVAEDGVMRIWLKVVQLEPTDSADRRMLEFRKVIDSIVLDVWKELNDEVRQQIIPIFGKLLESTSNPRKVIHKRDVKYMDYIRYQALKSSKKTIERNVAQSAAEFVALHTQLVDELPAFLEGCLRILDIALVGFAKVQSKYHQGVKERLAAYEEAWIQLPLSPKIERSPADTTTSKGIVKAWHDGWSPYADALDHFSCTRPARTAATRIATFNTKPGSRPTSRSNSPMLSPGHSLRHSASVNSPTSLNGSRPNSPAPSGRFRSSSLRSQTGPSSITVTSPKDAQSSVFSLLRRSNSRNNVPKTGFGEQAQAQNIRPSLHTRNSSGGGLKPSSSSMISDTSSRLSWGLPRISADPNQPLFDGLGLSPTKSINLGRTRSRSNSQRIISDPIGFSISPTANNSNRNMFSVDLNSSQISLSSTTNNNNNEISPPPTISRNASVGLGLGDVSTLSKHSQNQNQSQNENRHPFAVVPNSPRIRKRTDEIDAAEGWRNEQVIYQCACVADLYADSQRKLSDPSELGNKRYRGLKFLPMSSGDLIDVFHEVGRIDELPSFPYPEVGVDNDGVLVARSENGSIGLVICSFLEPLRD